MTWFFFVINDLVYVIQAFLILAPNAPVNHAEKHVDRRNRMRIEKMQETDGNITKYDFYQHKNGS